MDFKGPKRREVMNPTGGKDRRDRGPEAKTITVRNGNLTPDEWNDSPLNDGHHLEGGGSYRIIKLLGQGATGYVYLARVVQQPKYVTFAFPECVAIKMFCSLSGFVETAQRQEIQMMRGLIHPHIARIYDWYFGEPYHFAVLDYHERGSLLNRILQCGRLSPHQAMCLLDHILRALVEIHGHGILHRDIKPGNILIDTSDRYLLSDFGIARVQFQQGNTRVSGTPLYMSPEQARGENQQMDARADLYSLGATLWVAINGETTPDRNMSELIRERQNSTFSKLADRVSKEYLPIAHLIDRLLAFEAHRRPGSAAESLLMLQMIAPSGPSLTGLLQEEGSVGKPLDKPWRDRLENELSDPVSRDLLSRKGTFFRLRIFEDGDVICHEETLSYRVFVLLHGKVDILRHGHLLAAEEGEGSVIGEIAPLTGKPRTATLKARGTTVLALLNTAEMEQATRKIPALAVRIMKGLALRLVERDNRVRQVPNHKDRGRG